MRRFTGIHTKLVGLLCVVAAPIAFSACGSSSSSSSSTAAASGGSSSSSTSSAATVSGGKSLACKNGFITVGIAKAKSGASAFFDVAGTRGAKIAFDEINSQGGIKGCKIRTIEGDAKSDPATAAQVASSLIGQGAQILLVPDDFDSGIAAARVGQKAGVLTLSTAASSVVFSKAVGDKFFNAGPTTVQLGQAQAKFALAHGWKTTYVVVDPGLAYFTEQITNYTQVYTAGGGKIVGTDKVNSLNGQSDFSSTISKIRSMNPAPQVIVAQMIFPNIGSFVKQLARPASTLPCSGASPCRPAICQRRSVPRARRTSTTPARSTSRAPAGSKFSPDGTRIAVLSEDVSVVPSFGRVAVVPTAGGDPTVLTGELDRQTSPMVGLRAPVWRGDGELLFAVEDRGTQPLYRVDTDGSAAPEAVLDGERAIVGYDEAAGTLAVVSTSPTERPELAAVRDGVETRLTCLSAAFHRDVPGTAPEHLHVPSPGGGEIDVWVLRPRVAAGDRVPVLLSVHGGPMAQYPTAWFDEFALWAGAGYAVVWCNPHGSTGQSEEFLRSIRPPESPEAPGSGWGGVDADDVLAALDAALAHATDLDPDHVGVLGGSYGGYMTTWLAGHTDRFAAACSERAANNLLSLEWGGSDAAGFFRLELGGISHLDRPDLYTRLSPVTYAEDIDVPLLLLHADEDLRCPPEQADQLYLALRLLGREVEYWRFPDEGHDLSRGGSPRHRVARAEIILDFFARHLGGAPPAAG